MLCSSLMRAFEHCFFTPALQLHGNGTLRVKGYCEDKMSPFHTAPCVQVRRNRTVQKGYFWGLNAVSEPLLANTAPPCKYAWTLPLMPLLPPGYIMFVRYFLNVKMNRCIYKT